MAGKPRAFLNEENLLDASQSDSNPGYKTETTMGLPGKKSAPGDSQRECY